jgi:hypothetical protein
MATSVIPSSSSLSARRVSGGAFPQCPKLPVRAYDLSQALAIKIHFQALADVSEDECDSVLRQILVQLFESASRRVVNPRDRSRVHDKPAHGGGRFGRLRHVAKAGPLQATDNGSRCRVAFSSKPTAPDSATSPWSFTAA